MARVSNAKKWRSCPLQSISIEGGYDGYYEVLLPNLGLLPKLKKLELIRCKADKVNCTKAVVGLLQSQSSRLDSLRILGKFLEVDIDAVAAVLRETDSTPCVEIYKDEDNVPPNKLIAYLSSLNRHGRAKIAASGSTPGRLVTGLSSLSADTATPEYLKPLVAFGLLLENPGLWSSQGKIEKRNADGLLGGKRPLPMSDGEAKPKRSKL